MLSNEDRPVSDGSGAVAPTRKAGARPAPRFTVNARTAPRGSDSRIGDDETHRRLQEARNKAKHSTESIVRRVLGPEWAQD
jgi:hypothetical protein